MFIDKMKFGLMIMKGAPLHRHHIRLLTEMAMTCPNALILFGQNSWFTFEDRARMVENVFGNRFFFSQITDIGGSTTRDWGVHVFKTVQEKFPDRKIYLTDYIGGRREDIFWLKDFFHHDEFGDFQSGYQTIPGYENSPGRCMNRFIHAYDPITGQVDEDAPFGIRRLHMVRDEDHSHISATAIRTYLLLDDDHWKTMVPEVNHKLVEEAYMRGKNE